MDKREQAGKDYSAGMRYKDISTKYDVPVNTLKSWRTRDHWKRGALATKEMHPKQKRDAPKIVDELEANDKLTDKQKSFCLFYLQRFNATWAYQKAYQCSYETAMSEGSKCLRNPKVKAQLIELKKQQRTDLFVTAEDVARQYAKQAFADLGDYIDFGTSEEIVRDGWHKPVKDKITGDYLKRKVSFVQLKDIDDVDTSLLKGVHIGKEGVVVELYDKQKAMAELRRYLSENKSSGDNVTINFIRSDRRDKDGD
ncbi:terminase small subunit [Lactiplantibacillus brownii]|uniref:terminase small subunit n=1 Tax=Lactiplantibacillus brownii TaxID=3069269 RepID=UPI0038B34B70